MRYFEIIGEGRVYRIEWGSPIPVMVISNPSPPQASTLVEILRKTEEKIYIRGMMVRGKMVYVWDGYQMTHDETWLQTGFGEFSGFLSSNSHFF